MARRTLAGRQNAPRTAISARRNSDHAYARQQMLLEVSAFLSVVMKKAVRLPDQGRAWTLTADMKACEVRRLGYLEPANPLSMPIRGTAKQVPLYALDNPPRGID